MALRLSELVTGGELINTRGNSVHGWLGLRGLDRPLSLELTGDFSPDLKGTHIRFEVRENPDADHREPSEIEAAGLEDPKLSGLAWQQVGPTGTMTAARKVRVTDCPPIELYNRCKLGEPPPMTWKRCLYLEWFSQNGRVVVELVDPIIEFVGPDEPPAVAEDDPNAEPLLDEDTPETPEVGFSATSIELNADGDIEIRDVTPPLDESEIASDDSDDPYGLIPDELQREFDAQARETDRSLSGDQGDDDVIRELELMDELIERSDGEPLGMLFDGAMKLPRPDHLDERQAEQALKVLLARLAMHGVAFHICEHYTLLDAYRLLVEQFCQEECAFPELRGTQWVQHFSTSDNCAACEADFERQ